MDLTKIAITTLLLAVMFGGCDKPKSLAIERLELRKGTTRLNLDHLNEQDFGGSAPVVLDSTIDRDWAFTGWAIDAAANRPASGVVLLIDHLQKMTTRYGTSRPDVAAVTHQPSFAATGFELHVRKDAWGKGTHSISMLIISADSQGYYRAPQEWSFVVR